VTDGHGRAAVYRRAIKCELIGCTESNRIESNRLEFDSESNKIVYFCGESPITSLYVTVHLSTLW